MRSREALVRLLGWVLFVLLSSLLVWTRSQQVAGFTLATASDQERGKEVAPYDDRLAHDHGGASLDASCGASVTRGSARRARRGRGGTRTRLPDASDVWREIEAGPPVHRLTFDSSRVTDWDSGLVTFARKRARGGTARGIESDRAGLPDGVQRLLRLAEAVPERQTGAGPRAAPLAREDRRLGNRRLGREPSTGLAFLGEGDARSRRAAPRPGAVPDGRSPRRHPGLRAARARHRQPDQLPDRAHPRVRRGRPAPAVRRLDLRGEPGGHRDDPRDRLHHDRHRHGGPDRRGLRRAARHDDHQPGDRRALHHGDLADGVPRPAPDAGPDPDDAAAHDLRGPRRDPRAAPSSGWACWGSAPPSISSRPAAP